MTLMELRTKDIIAARDQGVTYKIIADQLGISQERVRQIVKKEERRTRIAAKFKTEIEEAKAKNAINELKIDVLNLSCMQSNVLYHENIKKIGQLVAMSEFDILKMPNMGKLGLRKIKEALGKLELSLKDEQP